VKISGGKMAAFWRIGWKEKNGAKNGKHDV